jgi:SRSO17 transposase
MVTFRDGPDGEPVTSRFIFTRVHAGHGWREDQRWTGWREGSEVPPREEWLIAEWPEDQAQPTDSWISNLPADTSPEWLARLARMRWKVELDYKQLKGELGLDHYEGRSWLGWYHHTALVSAAHGFLTLERLHPFTRGRPDTPEGRAATTADLQVLGRPLPNLPTDNRSRPAATPTQQTR